MEDNPDATGPSAAALVGCGMTLLAVGALIVLNQLLDRQEGDTGAAAIVGGIVVLFGWGLLTGGLVTMARRVDGLSRRFEATAPATTEATEASPPR